MSLCALSLCEAAADIREGRITSVELVDRLPRAHRRGRRQRCRPGPSSTATTPCGRRRRSTSTAGTAARSGRCTACRSASRTFSTPATCRPSSARRCGPAARRAATPRRSRALRAAGAVIMGKTVTTEYAYYHPGKTRNPHDPARTPGRLVERLGGGGRRRHGAGRDRLADQRLGDPPGGVLRRCRLQADAWAHPAHRRAACCRARSTMSACSRARSRTRRCWPRRWPATTRRTPTRGRSRGRRFAATAASEPPLPPRFAFVRSPAWKHAEPVTERGVRRADRRAWRAGRARSRSAQASTARSTCTAPSWKSTWRTISTATTSRAATQLSAPLRAAHRARPRPPAVDYTRAVAAIDPLNAGARPSCSTNTTPSLRRRRRARRRAASTAPAIRSSAPSGPISARRP